MTAAADDENPAAEDGIAGQQRKEHDRDEHDDDRVRDAQRVAAADGLDDIVRDGHGLAVCDKIRCAAENLHAGQRGDEGVDADLGDQNAVIHAGQRADEQAGQNGEACRHALVEQRAHHDAGQGDDRADGQVDVPGNDDKRHRACQNADVGGIERDVQEIVHVEEMRGTDGEEHDDDQIGDHQRDKING